MEEEAIPPCHSPRNFPYFECFNFHDFMPMMRREMKRKRTDVTHDITSLSSGNKLLSLDGAQRIRRIAMGR